MSLNSSPHLNSAFKLLEQLSDLPPSEDLLALVTWSLLCEPGDSTAGKLIDCLGASYALKALISRQSAEQIALEVQGKSDESLEYSPIELTKLIGDGLERWMPRLTFSAVLESLEIHAGLGGKIAFEHEDVWPAGLFDLQRHRPRMLWYRGSKETLEASRRSVSVVGARVSTAYGEMITQELTAAIVDSGAAVISGGAYGIDAMAHKTALASGGKTIAVMAGGLDALYPRANHQLLSRIISEGVVIAEVPAKVQPSKWRFLQRNRLIAAISQSTLVIEAGYKSGARNTAHRAAEIGRPVFAVPGAITSPSSQGCNLMIAERTAELVQNANDFLDLSGLKDPGQFTDTSGLGALETRTLDAIGFDAMSASDISAGAGLTSSETEFALSALSLYGLITKDGSRWRATRQTKV
jgi:DNA processing protein